ncbi:MAG: hypothetical protein KA712_15505 [Myxococcales bacterium]|nr:hypothetical protein [Myxococcales bacterium]
MSPWRVAALLVRFRFRHGLHAFRRGGASGSRWVSVLALGLPLAYVGLFVSAFQVVAARAPFAVQAATLALMAGGLVLASFAAKVTGGDAILAGTPENEFFLSRPVGLPTLVVARALASAVLDVFGSLFLVPWLAAVALVWRLGAPGILVAVALSWAMQVTLGALGQALALYVVGALPRGKRRLVQTALGLFSASAVAALWLVASFVLRQPERFVSLVTPWAGFVNAGPLGWLVLPLTSLGQGQGVRACVGLAGLVVFAAAAVAAAAGLAGRASRRGWEDAGLPVSHPLARDVSRRGRPLGVAGKELRSLVRDRTRLVALLAMPVLFVGVQVFGAAGAEVFAGDPNRVALLSYSLAAYLATLGPLAHMQGERRAFWILRSVPVPLWRLMAAKGVAWSLWVVGVGALSFWATWALAPVASISVGGLCWLFLRVVVGCVLVTMLAVGVGCNVADLSLEGKSALSPGAVYVFFFVAGLFNLALLREGEVAWRTLGLYVAAVALVFSTGLSRAALAMDPERTRVITPGDGALAAILLFAGTQLVTFAPVGTTRELQLVQAGWAALLALGMGAHAFGIWRQRGAVRGEAPGLVSRLLRGAGAFLVGTGLLAVARRGLAPAAPSALVFVLAEELAFRALLQRGVQEAFGARPGRVFGAVFVSGVVGSLAAAAPLSPFGMAVHFVAAGVYAASGSVWPAVLVRMTLVFQ